MAEELRVAILGATGHVGRALASELASRHSLTLYARRPGIASEFATTLTVSPPPQVRDISELERHEHDLLVNCIGVGDPASVTTPSIFESVTQHADDIALSYLARYPAARLVNISSGAASCSDFFEPATGEESASACDHNSGDAYALAKRASEQRHRGHAEAAIVDLRLFGFFSRYMDLNTTFLMSDVVRCLISGDPLKTGPDDLIRDYVAPHDLGMLVSLCMTAEPRNETFDVYSAAPVGKFELLDAFVERFGLTYSVVESRATGRTRVQRPAYYSLDRRSQAVGYLPTKTSLEVLQEETFELMKTIG